MQFCIFYKEIRVRVFTSLLEFNYCTASTYMLGIIEGTYV